MQTKHNSKATAIFDKYVKYLLLSGGKVCINSLY